jgi:dTDP-glucose 4,6-dehydratase/UDP-glucose 4-epimerase
MKILILGSSGFIGNSVKLYFLNRGLNVTVIDREELQSDYTFVKLLSETDVIINCIGSANVGLSFSDTSLDFDSNVLVVKRILEVMRTYDLNKIKFINLSSAAVYGNPLELPTHENAPTLPLSPYGYHKLISELLMKEYSQCFGLRTLSLRVFSAYGSGQKKLLFWDLHKKIEAASGIIKLFGTGEESRDYIHADDIAKQVLLVIENANFEGESLNVANGQEVRISTVANLFKKYYPTNFEFEFNNEVRLGDPLNWCADISKMKDWGYEPSIYLEEGISRYIHWLKND